MSLVDADIEITDNEVGCFDEGIEVNWNGLLGTGTPRFTLLAGNTITCKMLPTVDASIGACLQILSLADTVRVQKNTINMLAGSVGIGAMFTGSRVVASQNTLNLSGALIAMLLGIDIPTAPGFPPAGFFLNDSELLSNKFDGDAQIGIMMANLFGNPMLPNISSGNLLRGNNLSTLATTTRALFGPFTTNNSYYGASGSVVNLNPTNNITGAAPMSGAAGQAVADLAKATNASFLNRFTRLSTCLAGL